MGIYFKFLKMILASQMQYKTSFLLSAIGNFIVSFTSFLSMYFVFDRFKLVNGYTFSEILLCFSVMLTAFTSSEIFFRGFDLFPGLIRRGELDRILIRPRSVVFQVLTSTMEFARLGRFLQAVLMLAYALPASGVIWNADKVFTLIFMIVGGIITFSSIFILYAGVSFFTIEGIEFMNIFIYGSNEFGKYPLEIFGDTVLKIFTFVIPIALFQYYPFLYLTGNSDNTYYMFLPFISMLFAIPCYAFFRFGLSKYKSTGS